MHQVVLFSRVGCHLCEVARATILSVRSRHPFSYEEIDVESSDDLVRDYGLRVPVVAVDGDEIFEIEVDPVRLASLVRM